MSEPARSADASAGHSVSDAGQAAPGIAQHGLSDLRWCLIYALLLAAASSVPYLIGAARQDSNWEFTGFVVAVEDGNSYLAKMLSGQQGEWLFRSPYSSMPQRGVLAFLPYLLLGKLSNGSHEQLVLLFQLFRVACVPLLVIAVHRFAGRFVRSTAWRRWITVLATAGGGLGWLLIAVGRPGWLGSLPLEFYSPETFGFLAVLSFPHLMLARAGMLWALDLYLTRSSGWTAGIVLLVTGILHSPVLVPALAAVAAHQLVLLVWRGDHQAWRRKFAQLVVPVAPLLAYLALSLATDPYLQGWAAQNQIRSPNPLHYLLAYGALIPAAYLGARRLVRASDGLGLLPVSWALALPLLAYAPVDLQRRLTEGGWVALLVLAAVGLAGARPRLWRITLMVLLLPSSLLLFAGSLANLREPAEPIYRPAAQVAAFAWLAEHAESGQVVLAAYSTSNPLPAWAPVRVVAGHGPESVGLADLRPEIESFYSAGGTDESRLRLLNEQRVDYVYWGAAERALDGWEPGSFSCLQPAYAEQAIELFRVCDG